MKIRCVIVYFLFLTISVLNTASAASLAMAPVGSAPISKNILDWNSLGIDAHLKVAYGSPDYPSYIDHIFSVMQKYGLTRFRYDVPLTDDKPEMAAALQTVYASAKQHGITVKPLLEIPFTWGNNSTDNGKYPFSSGDAQARAHALYLQGYNRTYTFVKSFVNEIDEWEFENELSLKVQCAASEDTNCVQAGLGYTAEEFDLPAMHDWAAALKGMSDAIAQLNSENNLHMHRTIGIVGNHFGFLDFMHSNDIGFDVISYHFYGALKWADPHTRWGGPNKSNYDLFQKLATYNKPIVFNETNCSEIYQPNFGNESGDSLSETCFQALDKILTSLHEQTEVKIEDVDVYELFDEPGARNAAESRFGIFYHVAPQNDAPKVSAYVVAKHTGAYKYWPSSEQDILRNELAGRGLLSTN